ncbi:MAG: ABC transporter permease [Ginsengibacter sp.]
MIKNFFKIAWRNILRNKGFSIINISGLAIGMASAVLILLWIQNEMSHDKFHAKSDRIYTANNRDKFNGEVWAWARTPKVLGPTLKMSYPADVEDVVRSSFANFLFTVGEQHLNVQGNFVDSGFLNVFSFPILEGNTKQALNGNYNVVITQKLAKKLFGNQNAMGKVVRIDSVDNFTITGILKDLPNNTAFNFEYLLPWAYMKKIHQDDEAWGNNSVQTYILLKPGISQKAFDAKIKNITISHTVNTKDPSTTQVFTQLFSDQWLYSESENGKYVGGRIEQVKLFSIIAAFILLIACINFMNLSTARSEKRAKEVGIRKVVGAQKRSLVIQFISESIMLAFLAGVLAVIIVELSLGGYNKLVGKELYIDFGNPYQVVMKKYNSAYPFEYSFVDDQFNNRFASESLIGELSRIFAILAIIISCLGLFGLSAYTAGRRTKEIGIRKVLGASVTNVTRLLSKEFLQLVFISAVIAFPVAWWAMNNWLQNYSYRISISWWVFAIAGIVAIAIALFTVSFQAIKAAIANPAKSLRTE